MPTLADCAARVRERFPEALLEAEESLGMDVLVVEPARLSEVMTLLRDDLGFAMLLDVTAVDWLPRVPRFDVNYQLESLTTGARLRVKVRLDGDQPHVASVVGIWPTADWLEREVYDLMGVVFEGHPNLTRILMPQDWIGHPLRKDYPVGGVPVEYRIEPAYVGQNVVPPAGRPAAGGAPARLRRDRGRASHMTWTGPPATGVRDRGRPEQVEDASEEGEDA